MTETEAKIEALKADLKAVFEKHNAGVAYRNGSDYGATDFSFIVDAATGLDVAQIKAMNVLGCANTDGLGDFLREIGVDKRAHELFPQLQ